MARYRGILAFASEPGGRVQFSGQIGLRAYQCNEPSRSPASSPQLRVDLQGTGLGFVESHRVRNTLYENSLRLPDAIESGRKLMILLCAAGCPPSTVKGRFRSRPERRTCAGALLASTESRPFKHPSPPASPLRTHPTPPAAPGNPREPGGVPRPAWLSSSDMALVDSPCLGRMKDSMVEHSKYTSHRELELHEVQPELRIFRRLRLVVCIAKRRPIWVDLIQFDDPIPCW